LAYLVHNGIEVMQLDKQRRKELREAYKFRRPEMGVIAYHCKATGDLKKTIQRS